MFRILSLVALLSAAPSSAFAEPPVAPLTEEERVAFVQAWRKEYDTAVAALEAEVEKARATAANPATAARGKEMLASAKARLANITKNPHALLPHPIPRNSTPPNGLVVRVEEYGTVVRVTHTHTEQAPTRIGNGFNVVPGGEVTKTETLTFLVVPPIKGAKERARTTLPGVYTAAGTMTVERMQVKVLKRVDIKPEEIPGKK